MPRSAIRETIKIHAPIERCWALSTRIEIVQKTLGMTPVAGVTQGFIKSGSRVTWSGWKFGLPTRHHTLISRFEPPHSATTQPLARPGPPRSVQITQEAYFQDRQEKGRFASFHHDHFFREEREETAGDEAGSETITTLTDEVYFRLPFGFLGEFVARRIMEPYIRRLTRQRFAMVKQMAESERWKEWS